MPVDRLGEGIGLALPVTEVGEDFLLPVAHCRSERCPLGPLLRRQAGLPALIFLSGVHFVGQQPDVHELFLEAVGRAQLGELVRPGLHHHLAHGRQVALSHQHQFAVALERTAAVLRQPSLDASSDLLHDLVGHALDVELVHHNGGLRHQRLRHLAVRVPHVHADDLNVLAVFEARQVGRDLWLRARFQQVDDGFFLDVGQHAAVGALQVQLINAQHTGRRWRVAVFLCLVVALKQGADDRLIHAHLAAHVAVGAPHGGLDDVLGQPLGHAVVLGHFRQGGAERGVAGPTHEAAADEPERDPPPMQRQVTELHLFLAEPDHLAAHPAVGADRGIGVFHLEAVLVLFLVEPHDLGLERVEDVVGQIHA